MLAEEKTLHFARTASEGGPLGELVQWCDLITSLYILGHDIQVTVEHSEMLRYAHRLPRNEIALSQIFAQVINYNWVLKIQSNNEEINYTGSYQIFKLLIK